MTDAAAATNAALDSWLAQHADQLIDELRTMLRVPSLKDAPQPGAPFGKPVRDALDLALKIGADAGMRTKDLDGYAGYAEFGSGEKLVMALGHLDVVPVGDGWRHEPFGAEIDGEYIYSRGAIDDKGPTMAAFMAARAVAAVVPDLPARVRVVFGCDEESGMECITHYLKAGEDVPTFGFAPDAAWPVIHGEKGIVVYTIRCEVPADLPFRLLELTGGQRPNIVIDKCTARVHVDPSVRAEVEIGLADAWDKNVTCEWETDTTLRVHGTGKAAHGSTPWLGDSAAVRVLRRLSEIAPLAARRIHRDLLKLGHPSGTGLGIHGQDEPSGDLVSNVGIIRTAAPGVFDITVNVRYPVTFKGDDVRAKLEAHLATLEMGRFSLTATDDSPPLWFPPDHPLVETVTRVYREETGDMTPPRTMGGGTYARMIGNTVAIGTGWDGDEGAHETDERVKVGSIHRMARIYARVIHQLALR